MLSKYFKIKLRDIIDKLIKSSKQSVNEHLLNDYRKDIKDYFEENLNVIRGNFEHEAIELKNLKDEILILKNRNDRLSLILEQSIDVEKLPCAKGGLRLFQLTQVKLLTKVDKIFKEYGINYWLDFGTLLGAIRHKGFIPWDDDLDIGVTADDFEKLLSIDNEVFIKNGLVIIKEVKRPYIKLIFKDLQGITLLGVDVFPYYYQDLTRIKREELISILSKYPDKYLAGNVTKEEEFLIYEKPIIKETLNKAMYFDPKFCYYKNKDLIMYKDVFPLIQTEFEGYSFPIPGNYIKVLITRYGDYYKLPSSLSGHISEIDYNSEKVIKLLNRIINR